AYQQCVGFLRIPGAANILDNTAVHPESYGIVESMARDNRCPVEQLVIDKKLRQTIDLSKYVSDSVGLPTLNDIMAELEKPGRDPRTEVEVLEFDDNVHTIDDVQEGMVLNGIVTNVTQFGVFVDFGIKENGLVHISEICDKYIASPTEMVSLHQHVKVKVLSVDRNRKRISLTMKGI
ncbi:MAG: S1 RNA-binding domain-containing protein, partial [Muribaculaceae bacterium]|nr:S1 RNA-binding domain-containing protein [Muribaculaceae bacterium]